MIEIDPALLRRALAGDPDAHKQALALLPKEGNLFGRWATHPKYGRVLCVSDNVDHDGLVSVYYRTPNRDSGGYWQCLLFDSLEFDPTELATVEDFEDAPEGTIVDSPTAGVHEKQESGLWHYGIRQYSDATMAREHHPWQVVRWGKGEQA